MASARPESFTLTSLCPLITVRFSPSTVTTIGSEPWLLGGEVLSGLAGSGILPIIAVAPAATAATPTLYFRKSLRDILFFGSSDSTFSSPFLFSFKNFLTLLLQDGS